MSNWGLPPEYLYKKIPVHIFRLYIEIYNKHNSDQEFNYRAQQNKKSNSSGKIVTAGDNLPKKSN